MAAPADTKIQSLTPFPPSSYEDSRYITVLTPKKTVAVAGGLHYYDAYGLPDRRYYHEIWDKRGTLWRFENELAATEAVEKLEPPGPLACVATHDSWYSHYYNPDGEWPGGYALGDFLECPAGVVRCVTRQKLTVAGSETEPYFTVIFDRSDDREIWKEERPVW